jgi:hypothetical protein
VLERFFLMPLVVVAPLVGLGVGWIGQILSDYGPSRDFRRTTVTVAAAVVGFSLIVVWTNYTTLNVSNDHVTGNYARDALGGLRPHTILFATGDESDTPALYMTEVANFRPDVTVLLAPLLSAAWYVRVLRQDHQINVPAKVTTLNIIRANPNRPVAFMGLSPDNSINGKYYLYPDGLVNLLERANRTILVTQVDADNEAQLARIHVPNYKSIKPDSLEPIVLDHYSDIAYHIGQDYGQAGQSSEAIAWYRKALAMNPSMSIAANAIRELGGKP